MGLKRYFFSKMFLLGLARLKQIYSLYKKNL